MKFQWLLLVSCLLLIGSTVVAQIIVEPADTPPVLTQGNDTTKLSSGDLQILQKIALIEAKIGESATKTDVDVLLGTQLKLQKTYFDEKVNFLTIVTVLVSFFCVAGVASIYFLLKAKGRL